MVANPSGIPVMWMYPVRGADTSGMVCNGKTQIMFSTGCFACAETLQSVAPRGGIITHNVMSISASYPVHKAVNI